MTKQIAIGSSTRNVLRISKCLMTSSKILINFKSNYGVYGIHGYFYCRDGSKNLYLYCKENNDWHGFYCMILTTVFLICMLKYFKIKIEKWVRKIKSLIFTSKSLPIYNLSSRQTNHSLKLKLLPCQLQSQYQCTVLMHNSDNLWKRLSVKAPS